MVTMGLDRNEIIQYARRYVEEQDINEFPFDGDLFCLFSRQIPTDRVLDEEEGWNFGGYGITLKYEIDPEAKPAGKWIWFHFLSLASFPPAQQVIKLQPPHIVKGHFMSPDRLLETRIMRIPWQDALKKVRLEESFRLESNPKTRHKKNESNQSKVLKFPKKKD